MNIQNHRWFSFAHIGKGREAKIDDKQTTNTICVCNSYCIFPQ